MPNTPNALGLAAFLMLTGLTAEAHAQRAVEAASQPTRTTEEAADEGSGEGLEGGEAAPEARRRAREERNAKAQHSRQEASEKRSTAE